MICPFCEKEGKKSTLYSGGCRTTLMGGNFSYYDEEGAYHYHNPNRITSAYECSNKHLFETKSTKHCPNPNCDFGKEEPIVSEDFGKCQKNKNHTDY